jgi:hypothetical protein
MRRAERFWRLGVGIALVMSVGLGIYGCSDPEDEVFVQQGRAVMVTPDTSTVFHREPSLNIDQTTVIFSTDWPFDPSVDEDKTARDIAVINLPEDFDGYPITSSPDTIAAAQFRKVVFGLLSSDASGGGTVQFDANLKGKSNPTWNPTNGSEFAVVIQNANFLDRIYICTVDLSQSGTVPVTSSRYLRRPDSRLEWYFDDPAYSRDGRWLLFSRFFFRPAANDQEQDITEPQTLWAVELATGEEYQLTSGSSREGDAAWSPNGTSIVFTSNREATTGGGRDLFAIDFDPSAPGAVLDLNLRRLTFSNNDGAGPSYVPVESFDPVWAPNGRDITFVSTRRNTGVSLRDRSIWIMNNDGSDQRELIFTRFDDVNPAYDQFDAGRLVYASGDHPLQSFKGQRSDIWLLSGF